MKEGAPTETLAFNRFIIPGDLGQLVVHLLTDSRPLYFLAHLGEMLRALHNQSDGWARCRG